MATCTHTATHTQPSFLCTKRGEWVEPTKGQEPGGQMSALVFLRINNNDNYFKISTMKIRGKHGQQEETQQLFMRLLELIIGTH